ncbi:MAG: M23 family metallopeptidase [Henriciella sp.]
MLLIGIAVQLFFLSSTLLGLFLFRSINRKEAWLRIFAGWLMILGLFLAGVWYYPSALARWGVALVAVLACYVHLRRSLNQAPFQILRPSHIATFTSSLLGAILIWQGTSGHYQPNVAVIDLSSPMDPSSKICVLSGGSSAALNLHYFSSATPGGEFERHSVDFVKHDRWGNRTIGWSVHPQPRELDAYLTFNEPVFAPCDGIVVARMDGKEDHPAGARFRSRAGSNFVTLRCSNTDIVMAHLKKGSVAVEIGQSVLTGTKLGIIGHSGNSEEPHLHINAQTVVDGKTPNQFPQPVAMTFNGKYLARGDCVS